MSSSDQYSFLRLTPDDKRAVDDLLKKVNPEGRSEEWIMKFYDEWVDAKNHDSVFFIGAWKKGTGLVGIGCLCFNSDYEATAEAFRAYDPTNIRLGRRIYAECITKAFLRKGPFYLRAIVATDNYELIKSATGKALKVDSARWVNGIDRHLLMEVEGGWQTLEVEPAEFDEYRHDPPFELRVIDPSKFRGNDEAVELAEWKRCHQRERQNQFDPMCSDDSELEGLLSPGRTDGYAWNEWACFAFSGKTLSRALRRNPPCELVHVVQGKQGSPDDREVCARFIVSKTPCKIRDVETYQVEAVAFDSARLKGNEVVRSEAQRKNTVVHTLLTNGLRAYAHSKSKRLIVHGKLGAEWVHQLYSAGARPDRWYQDVILRRVIRDYTVRDIGRWVIEQFESTHRSF